MHDCLNSPLGSDLVVEAVEILGGGTVEVEPPVADEVVLVEESSVGTEEAVLGQTSSSVSSADVESLALSLGVSVVTWKIFQSFIIVENISFVKNISFQMVGSRRIDEVTSYCRQGRDRVKRCI